MSSIPPRRRWLTLSAASLAISASPFGPFTRTVYAQSAPRAPIADMHSHMGMFNRTVTPGDLATDMHAHGANIVAWKIVADGPWIGVNRLGTGIEQLKEPQPGERWAFFQRASKLADTYIESKSLGRLRRAGDVDTAMAGKPHVLLACEGSDFLEGKLDNFQAAFDVGIRHMQLVHYARNEVGDFQTMPPTHGGLSAFGREVLAACEARGVLVDLAHLAAPGVDQALAAAKKPLVWSHGWVEGDGGSHNDRFGFLKRRLSVAQAKAIAAKGGVVGLWGFGLDRPGFNWWVGRGDRQGYAKELVKLVNVLGADAVGLGTDIAGVGSDWSVNDYAQVRETLEHALKLGMPASTVEKVAGGNFARVLKAVLPA
jgi:membrane dipeptidase